MSISTVSSASYTTATSNTNRKTSNSLGKEDFLSLLVTQLKYQDPLDPSDSTEYISQLAQFSSLEQMSNMSAGISSMEALSMTGKYVTATVTDSGTEKTSSIEGIVDSVKLKNGKTTLVVDGKDVELENITSVKEDSEADIYSLSSMVGKACKGYVYDSNNLNVIGVEGTVSGVEKGEYEKYALMDGVKCSLDSITSSDYKSSQSKLEYLNSHTGKEISIKIKDSNNKSASITAKLNSVSQDSSGNITVTMDNVKVPVDGIYSVK